MATHSSILAWKIPWTEQPGGLQSIADAGRDWGQDRTLLTEEQHMISRDIVSLVMNSDGVQPRSQVALSAEEAPSAKQGQHLPPTTSQPRPMIDG